MNNLAVVRPFLGEMGWELLRWQAYIRYKSYSYYDMVVFCQKGYEYFYEFKNELMAHVIGVKVIDPGIPDCWDNDTAKLDYYWRPEEFKEADIIVPSKEICCGDIEQEWIKFGEHSEDFFDVVIHARAEKRNGTEERNWSKDKWEALVDGFRGLKICCIGSKGGSHAIRGAKDMRGISMEPLCNLLASSRTCIGPSSGPIHLASLCGCPHITWSDKKKWMVGDKQATNRERYCTIWNPLGTKVEFIDDEGWNPSVGMVEKTVRSLI